MYPLHDKSTCIQSIYTKKKELKTKTKSQSKYTHTPVSCIHHDMFPN